MSIFRLTLLALVACAPLLAQAAQHSLTTAWPVNVGPLNPHLYTPNQMFAQSMVYEPLVKYQADGSVQPGWRPAGATPPMVKPGGLPCARM